MSGIFHQKKKQASQSLQNVKVVVRIRPLSKRETEQNVKNVVTAQTHRELILKEKKYTFDRVFKPGATQIELYLDVVSPLIQDVVEGYNCTVFAYGQTGTGKTYTMTGEKCNLVGNWKKDEDAGVIPRAAFHIFDELEKMVNIDMSVKVSYIELYNEEIRDLLSHNENILQMYSDNKGTVSIQGLTEISVHDGEGICKLLQRGIVKRQIAPTLMNHQSSRSHTVFTISINTSESTASGDDILKAGKINLVDLAGNENIARSGCKDLRAVELANINRSLLTLGRVIQALAEKSHKHVPYRDSKLTRILQDSLGGHTKTAIIATVSPAHNSHEETTSTLDYASRARDIKNTPTINEKLSKHDLIDGLVKEIDRLQKDLDAARLGTGFYVDKENYQKMLDAISAVTGEDITMEELTEKKAARIKNLEDRMYSKIKEFEKTVEQCKKNQHELDMARATIKRQDDVLEQEKFLSKWYEHQTSEKLEEAQKLLAVTKTLHGEKELLLAKLEHQFKINISNQQVTQTAVSNVINMLDRFGDDECKKNKHSKYKVKEELERNMLDLQRDFCNSSNTIKTLGKECESKIREEQNGFSINKCILMETKPYFDQIKKKTDVFQSVLTQYEQQLNILKSEIPKKVENCRKTSEKFLHEAMLLIESSDKLNSDVVNEQNKKAYENLDNLEKCILERKKEFEYMITVLQKGLEEDSVSLDRIKVDKENITIAERIVEKNLLEKRTNLETLAKESMERMEAYSQLPDLIDIQDVQVQDFLIVVKEFEAKLNRISSILNEKHEIPQHIIHSFNESFSNICRNIDEDLDEKVKDLLDKLEMMMEKTDIVESFSVFVMNIKEVLTEQILDKNVKAKHIGDTPVRQSTTVPSRIKNVAPREALIQQFKEAVLTRMEESEADHEM